MKVRLLCLVAHVNEVFHCHCTSVLPCQTVTSLGLWHCLFEQFVYSNTLLQSFISSARTDSIQTWKWERQTNRDIYGYGYIQIWKIYSFWPSPDIYGYVYTDMEDLFILAITRYIWIRIYRYGRFIHFGHRPIYMDTYIHIWKIYSFWPSPDIYGYVYTDMEDLFILAIARYIWICIYRYGRFIHFGHRPS